MSRKETFKVRTMLGDVEMEYDVVRAAQCSCVCYSEHDIPTGIDELNLTPQQLKELERESEKLVRRLKEYEETFRRLEEQLELKIIEQNSK